MNRKTALMTALTLTICYFILVIIFLDMRFSEGDDFAVELVTALKLPNSDFYPIFFGNYLEVIFYNLLKFLSKIYSGIGWFALISQLLNAVNYFIVTFSILQKTKTKIEAFTLITFFSTFFIFFITNINFTAIPMSLALPIGFLIGSNKKNSILKVFLLITLMFFALSLRGLAFFTTFGLVLFYLFLKKNHKKFNLKETLKYITYGLIPLSFYLVSPSTNNQIIDKNTYNHFLKIGELGKGYEENSAKELKLILKNSSVRLVEIELLKNQIIYDFSNFSQKTKQINAAKSNLKKPKKSLWERLTRLNRNILKRKNTTIFLIIFISVVFLYLKKNYLIPTLVIPVFYLGLLIFFSIKLPGNYFVYPYIFVTCFILLYESIKKLDLKDRPFEYIFIFLIVGLSIRYLISNIKPEKMNLNPSFAAEISKLKKQEIVLHIIDEDVLRSIHSGIRREKMKAKILTRGWRALGKNNLEFLKNNNLSMNMCENLINKKIILISSDYYAYLYHNLCELKSRSLCLKRSSAFNDLKYWQIESYTDECQAKLIKNGLPPIKKVMPYFSKVFNDDMSLKTQ